MDRPPPEPAKLLAAWMEWERGETPPGRVMSNLKMAGMREVLEGLVAAAEAAASEAAASEAAASEAAASEAGLTAS